MMRGRLKLGGTSPHTHETALSPRSPARAPTTPGCPPQDRNGPWGAAGGPPAPVQPPPLPGGELAPHKGRFTGKPAFKRVPKLPLTEPSAPAPSPLLAEAPACRPALPAAPQDAPLALTHRGPPQGVLPAYGARAAGPPPGWPRKGAKRQMRRSRGRPHRSRAPSSAMAGARPLVPQSPAPRMGRSDGAPLLAGGAGHAPPGSREGARGAGAVRAAGASRGDGGGSAGASGGLGKASSRIGSPGGPSRRHRYRWQRRAVQGWAGRTILPPAASLRAPLRAGSGQRLRRGRSEVPGEGGRRPRPQEGTSERVPGGKAVATAASTVPPLPRPKARLRRRRRC